MNIANFTAPQRQALLDLLVLAMYVDGHLTLAEDERLRRLLAAMGFDSEFDRGRQLDAAVTRIRQHSGTAQAARDHTVELSKNFTSRDERRQVCELLDDMMASDGHVAPQEGKFLSDIREIFRI